jgi:hypothetical protein
MNFPERQPLPPQYGAGRTGTDGGIRRRHSRRLGQSRLRQDGDGSEKSQSTLAAQKKNTALLLCDMTAPMMPCICPPSELEVDKSLGSIFAAQRISVNLIKHNLTTLKRLPHLTMLGLRKKENEYTYAPCTKQQAEELIRGLLRRIGLRAAHLAHADDVRIETQSDIQQCDLINALALIFTVAGLRVNNRIRHPAVMLTDELEFS